MTTKTMDMQTFHQQLEAEAAKAPHALRDNSRLCVGAAAHQGDVYIHRIAKKPTTWNVETGGESRQVALGATIGSRHCSEGAGVRVFWPDSREGAVAHCPLTGFVDKLGNGAGECLGPVVVAEGPWTLTHPEHAHHQFPAGTYLVTYQLDYNSQRAVRD